MNNGLKICRKHNIVQFHVSATIHVLYIIIYILIVVQLKKKHNKLQNFSQ
jgi:hypothetical protein